MSESRVSVESIKKAKESFPIAIKETPLEYNARLSEKYECKVFLKREDLQRVRSYKIRGAFNVINSLSPKDREKGVVCASAGNHAQGVAYTCKFFKIHGIIFMPRTTPPQKIERTKEFGGKYVQIKLVGDTYDESSKHAIKFCEENRMSFVDPFNDPRTISGQGTIGLEILNQDTTGHINYIICPIGGGGLISGVGTYISKLSPKTKIIGAEPEGAASMNASLKKGEVVELENIDAFVDGAAVKRVGNNGFNISKNIINQVVLVPENRLCTSILEFLREDGIILEPAGALSVDALKDMKDKIKGKTVVCIVSGSNFDFDRLAEVKERSMRYEGFRKYYILRLPQRSGSLKEFLSFLGPDMDIVRFEYLRKSSKIFSTVLVGLQTRHPEKFNKLDKMFKEKKISYEDITDSELYFDLLV